MAPCSLIKIFVSIISICETSIFVSKLMCFPRLHNHYNARYPSSAFYICGRNISTTTATKSKLFVRDVSYHQLFPISHYRADMFNELTAISS